MSATFTPLVLPASAKPANGAQPLRNTVISATPATHFKPFLQGSAPPCQTPASPPPATSTAPATENSAPANPPANPPVTLPAPTVTYVQENGQITRIRIQCACGSVTELECLY